MIFMDNGKWNSSRNFGKVIFEIKATPAQKQVLINKIKI